MPGTPPLPPRFRSATSVIILAVLFLATIQCALCIFWVNYSYVDLKAYASGTAPMPYQGRIAMMPILRAAENSPAVVSIAHKIDVNRHLRHGRYTFETITPEKLASVVVGILSLLASVTVACVYGVKRFGRLWWFPPSLLLVMLFITQGARYEVTLWYPYDLPHAFLFGTACLLILEGLWLPAALVFLVDLPVRETAIFLAAVSVTVGWARSQRKQGLTTAAFMFAVWLPFTLYIHHRFAANPSTEMGIHTENFRNGLNPTHWPQMFSAFGFLLIPLAFGNRLLAPAQRAFLLGAIPCLVVTLGFGVWNETRIFGEWLLPTAVLLTAEFIAFYRPALSAT